MDKNHITDSNFEIKFYVWRIFIKPLRAMSAVGGQTIPSLVTFSGSHTYLHSPENNFKMDMSEIWQHITALKPSCSCSLGSVWQQCHLIDNFIKHEYSMSSFRLNPDVESYTSLENRLSVKQGRLSKLSNLHWRRPARSHSWRGRQPQLRWPPGS